MVLVALASLFAIFCGIAYIFPCQPPDENFEATCWRTCENHSSRYAMHRDLLHSVHIIGMTKEQLLELLGPPDTADANRMSWNMGQTAENNDNWLDMCLKDGKVENFYTRHWINPYDLIPQK